MCDKIVEKARATPLAKDEFVYSAYIASRMAASAQLGATRAATIYPASTVNAPRLSAEIQFWCIPHSSSLSGSQSPNTHHCHTGIRLTYCFLGLDVYFDIKLPCLAMSPGGGVLQMQDISPGLGTRSTTVQQSFMRLLHPALSTKRPPCIN
jgi:hypothetical protein